MADEEEPMDVSAASKEAEVAGPALKTKKFAHQLPW